MGWLGPFISLVSGLFSWFSDRQKEQVGAVKEDNKMLGEELSDVEKAKAARDALSDPATADKLRGKYQRD
jgi:hypothetical protein